MKTVIGVIMYYEIEVPDYTIEDYENQNFDPVYEEFWNAYNRKELGQGEAFEIDCLELLNEGD